MTAGGLTAERLAEIRDRAARIAADPHVPQTMCTWSNHDVLALLAELAKREAYIAVWQQRHGEAIEAIGFALEQDSQDNGCEFLRAYVDGDTQTIAEWPEWGGGRTLISPKIESAALAASEGG
jgi:hypothetical protein